MTLRTAADALAEAVDAMLAGQWVDAGHDCDIRCSEGPAVDALASTLTAYRSATTQAKRGPVADQHAVGLYAKFTVYRNDGRDVPGGDRAGAQYIVLDVTYDAASRVAAIAYAKAIAAGYPQAAFDIRALVDESGPLPPKREPVVHFYSSGWRTPTERFGTTTCGHRARITADPAAVTCKLCRRSRKFQEASP